jgi:RNA polymerase sigma-70 factor (ECF subfamily)
VASLPPFEAYRGYLKVIASARLPLELRRHIDDSDIVQQTLLEAHASRATFQGDTPAEQRAWLRRILARNVSDAVRGLRRARRDIRHERSLQDLLDRTSARLEHWVASAGTTPDSRAETSEHAVALARAIDGLPADQRLAVILRHLNGLALSEIANQMERSPQAVAGLLHRGLRQLRGVLDGAGPP